MCASLPRLSTHYGHSVPTSDPTRLRRSDLALRFEASRAADFMLDAPSSKPRLTYVDLDVRGD